MTCTDFKADLVAFLDGRLAPDRASAFRDHIAACPACREEARTFEGSWDLLGRLGTLEPPAGFPGAVHRRIDRAGRSRILKFAGVLVAAAAAILIAISTRTPAAEPTTEAEKALSGLPAEDRRLLEDLARDDTWELAENIELIRAYELLDREGNGFLPGEDH